MVLLAARTINRTLVYLWLLMNSMVEFRETRELVGARQPQGQSERETVAPGKTVPNSLWSHLRPYPRYVSFCHCKFCQMSHSHAPAKMHQLGVWKATIPTGAENENLIVAQFDSNHSRHCDSDRRSAGCDRKDRTDRESLLTIQPILRGHAGTIFWGRPFAFHIATHGCDIHRHA
jgi:hypothetical protein